jgi:foldase protein PrsA
MRSLRRPAALLSAFFVFPLVLAACGGGDGGGVPGNAVFKIGSDSIKTSVFDHWFVPMALMARQQSGVTAKVVIPRPPAFAECIASKKKRPPKPPQLPPSDAGYKALCEQEYAGPGDQTMQFLIRAAWIEGEAADRGIKVSDAQVKKSFDAQRMGPPLLGSPYRKDKDYLAYLKSSGNIQENLLYRAKILMLAEKLRNEVLGGVDKVTDAQIVNYYNTNKNRFAFPPQRDLRIVLTKTQAQAKKARKALDSGQSFKTVVSRYSIDQATRRNGGVLTRTGTSSNQREAMLVGRTVSAPIGEVTGPIQTPFGYLIFEVTKVTPGKPKPLTAELKTSLRSLLTSKQQQAALDKFVKDSNKKWKERTLCRKGYEVADCSNPPRPSTPRPPSAPTAPSLWGVY